MFEIDGTEIRHNDYLEFKREKVTTTIREEYWSEYKKLMKKLGETYGKGLDVLLIMLAEDKDMFDTFISKVKKY